MMSFKEAKARLKELAGGKYHATEYNLTEFSSGREEQQCKIYIDKENWYSGSTWEHAFEIRSGEPTLQETIEYQMP